MFTNKKDKVSQKNNFSTKKPGLLTNIIFLTMLSVAVTSLMVMYIDRLPSNIYEGGIATQNIRADQNYEIVDTEASNNLKEQASLSSPLVYDYDINLADERIKKIQTSFLTAREQLKPDADSGKKSKSLTKEEEKSLKENFLLNLGFAIEDNEYKILRKAGFSADLEKSLSAFINVLQMRPIIHDKNELPIQKDMGIVLKILSEEDKIQEEYTTDFSQFLSIQEAREFFKKKETSKWQNELKLGNVDSSTVTLAIRLMPQFIKVNVTIDKSETEKRKERTISSVENIVHKLQKGQNIILRGERYMKRHLTILNGIRETHLQTNVILKFLGVLCLVMLLLYTVYFYAHEHIAHFHLTQKDLNFIGLMLILFIAILRFGSFLGGSLQDTLPFSVDLATFYYIIPIAAGAMMVRYILNAEIALIFSIVLSFFAGMFLEYNYGITAYYFLSSIIASHVIGQVEKRSTVLNRSLLLGSGNILIVIGLSLITTISTAATIDYIALSINCIFAFLGGVTAGLTLLAISPIMETLFNYTTNIQLLELANMNHPLLREMIVRAPGTYHHSQLVGVLAESGSRAIGGNPLLARVASYYHDIGKMKKPQYFVENQKNTNPHDHLAPSMSALIVESHIKDGLEMAKEHKLPRIISDFIPEHQGTKLISYFYHKATSADSENADNINEKDYRYKGPKPQTRESGVVMLADTIEAAVRSMPDKSPQKIRAQVEKLLNMHFVDGQLSECDLTLRDIYLITEAFIKTLIGGIYHQRVEYPEDQYDKKTSSLSIVANDEAPEPEHSDQQPSSKDENISSLFKNERKKGT